DRAIKEASEKCESISEKSNKKKEIKEIFKERLIKFYKQLINPNAKKLLTQDLDQKEKFALRYRHLNPRVMAIFDDAFTEVMALIRQGRKKEDETIKNFFFKGRHANITHIYGFQDDNHLDSEVRKNAHISIFTSKQVALAYFGRAANNFSALEKKRAESVINTIFDEHSAMKYTKLVYSRLYKFQFQYIIADEHEDHEVQMCSKIAREYCKKVASKEGDFDVDNPYFQKFKE